MNVPKLSLAIVVLAFSFPLWAQEDEHGHEEEESTVVEMTAGERSVA